MLKTAEKPDDSVRTVKTVSVVLFLLSHVMSLFADSGPVFIVTGLTWAIPNLAILFYQLSKKCTFFFTPGLTWVSLIFTQSKAVIQLDKSRDSRKSLQKMAKNTADFCENLKNHGQNTAKTRHQITGPKTIILYTIKFNI